MSLCKVKQITQVVHPGADLIFTQKRDIRRLALVKREVASLVRGCGLKSVVWLSGKPSLLLKPKFCSSTVG